MRKIILFGVVALMLAACEKDGRDQSLIDDEAIQTYLAENNIEATKHSSGIYYVMEQEGEGVSPDLSSVLEVKYIGKLLNGTEFDKTEDNKTAIFPLGNLIEGWRIALPLFKEGGKGTIIIPSHLAYGSQEVGNGAVPANSVLIFEIELVSVFDSQSEADEQIILNYLADNELEATAHESGIYYIINQEGEGEHPTLDSEVEVRYKGMFANGSVFDKTADGETKTWPLENLIEGWKISVPLLKAGGKGTFLMPSEYGYGENGAGIIPPNAVLIFEIELVGFE